MRGELRWRMQKVVNAPGRAPSGEKVGEGSLDGVPLRQIGGEGERGPQLTRCFFLHALSQVRHAEVVAGSRRLRLEPLRLLQAWHCFGGLAGFVEAPAEDVLHVPVRSEE